MTGDAEFYRVLPGIEQAPLRDYLMHGYESELDFRHALRQLVNRWKRRVGECVGERNGFLLLRFHDTPGGRPDEAWLPKYLLQSAERPGYAAAEGPGSSDETEEELDRAFGFD